MPFEQIVVDRHKPRETGECVESADVMTASRGAAQVADWTALYAQNWRWIARVVRRLGPPDVDVEAAVQDVFVVLVERLGDFEGRSDVRTWIYRVAMNVASEHRRRAWRRRRLAAAWGAVAFWREAPATPEQGVERRDEVAMVQEMMAALSEKKREVFVLCELEELSSDDAAAVLGVPAATVRTRLFHARKEVAEVARRMGLAE